MSEMAAAAPAAGKGKRKRHLSEDDVYLLLHRSVRPSSAPLVLGPSLLSGRLAFA
jgi:hypothetical protein